MNMLELTDDELATLYCLLGHHTGQGFGEVYNKLYDLAVSKGHDPFKDPQYLRRFESTGVNRVVLNAKKPLPLL